jgi:5-formyltetrahydrofolate cyclo-ligase
MDLAARKAALRREMDARRRGVAPREAAAAGEAAARALAALPEWSSAARVALYADAFGELPSGAFLRALRARGALLLWPRLRGAALEFAACDPEALEPGAFGVAAPSPGLPAVPLGPADLVLVPALALDAAGRRLGRGGGHYDRAFGPPLEARPLLVGVGYDFQLVDEVPAGEGDGRVDWVVTERRLLRTGARGARG